MTISADSRKKINVAGNQRNRKSRPGGQASESRRAAFITKVTISPIPEDASSTNHIREYGVGQLWKKLISNAAKTQNTIRIFFRGTSASAKNPQGSRLTPPRKLKVGMTFAGNDRCEAR